MASRSDFEHAFEVGSLQFGRCNVRGGRTVLYGEARYTVVDCEPTQEVLPLTANARGLYDMLRVFGRTGGGIVATCLRELEADSFTGLTAAGLPVQKALLLVKGLERSHMDRLGDQRKMITPVKCIFEASAEGNEPPHYKVVAFCHEDFVSDYKFDKGQALVLATGVCLVQENPETYAILAETITTVLSDDVNRTRDALQMQTTIAQSMVTGSGGVPETLWEESPPSKNKRCRSIGNYPSDPA